MKYLQSYNESLRDQMTPKSEDELKNTIITIFLYNPHNHNILDSEPYKGLKWDFGDGELKFGDDYGKGITLLGRKGPYSIIRGNIIDLKTFLHWNDPDSTENDIEKILKHKFKGIL